MMKHAGVSVTITSLTNFSAFAIGSITTIPAIRNFCWYCAFGMLFDYLNQFTFFVAIVGLDVRRSNKIRGDCCGAIFCKPEQCCGGKYDNDEPAFSTRIMRDFYAKNLVKLPVKILVLVVFGGLLALNAYGVANIDLMFDYEWFVV